MKYLVLLLIFGFGISGFAQTIRTLGFNTTNGQVVAATNVVWTNAFNFSTNTVAAQVRTNLGLGGTWLTNTNVTNFRTSIGLGWSALTNTNATNFRSAIGLGINDNVTLAYGTEAYIGQDGGSLYVDNLYPEYIQCGQFGIGFGTTDSAATTRTNLGLGATWLTNTNATNFRSAIGLGESDAVSFSEINLTDAGVITSSGQLVLFATGNAGIAFNSFIMFDGADALSAAATTRANLGIGSFNSENGFSTIADESNNTVISTEGGIPLFYGPLEFNNTTNAATTRTNLGLGATWLTNTNATNFRTDIGLGSSSAVIFGSVAVGNSGASLTAFGGSAGIGWQGTPNRITFADSGIALTQNGMSLGFGTNATGAATTRTNLGIGGGITTNRTFVSYNGTNYTTNTVTISNGIITGWTQ